MLFLTQAHVAEEPASVINHACSTEETFIPDFQEISNKSLKNVPLLLTVTCES